MLIVASGYTLIVGRTPGQPAGEYAEPTGEDQHADQDQEHAGNPTDHERMAVQPRQQGLHPAEEQRHQHERQAEPDRVRQQQGSAPRSASPVDAASARMVPRMGPTHGVHPAANAIPMTTAAPRPNVFALPISMRASPYSHGTLTIPSISTPNAITTSPATFSMSWR